MIVECISNINPITGREVNLIVGKAYTAKANNKAKNMHYIMIEGKYKGYPKEYFKIISL